MAETKKTNKKQLFWNLIISYICLILAAVFVCVVIFVPLMHNYKSEIEKNNLNSAERVWNMVDGELSKLESISAQLMLNPRLKMLVNRSVGDEAGYYSAVENMIDDLKSVSFMTNKNITTYLYVKEANGLVTNTSYWNAGSFFSTQAGLRGTEYAAFFNQLNKQQYKTLLPVTLEQNGQPVSKIAYISTLSEKSAPLVNLIALMDCTAMESAMAGFDGMKKSTLYVLDEDQNTILSVRAQEGESAPVTADVLKKSVQTIKTQNGRMVLTYVKSAEANWNYLALTPYYSFYHKLVTMQVLVVSGVLLLLLASALIMVRSIRKNYQPVRNMMHMISQKTGVSVEENEFKFLQDTLSKTINKNEEMQEYFLSQSGERRANFLRRALLGRIDPGADLSSLMERAGVTFPESFFAVFLIDIKDFGDFFEGTSVGQYQKTKTIQLIFTNIIEELLQEAYKGYVVDLDDYMLAAVVNFRDRAQFTGFISFLENARTTILSYFNFDFTFALSGMHEQILSLQAAYQEALEALDYKIVAMPDKKIMQYEQIPPESVKNTNYMHAIEDEYRLISFAQEGEYQKICEILDVMFDKSFGDEGISISAAKYLLFSMTSMVIKIIGEIKSDYLQEKLNILEITEKLASCDNAWSLKQRMKEVFYDVCEITGQDKGKNIGTLMERIERYVERNYRNGDLNITTIAQSLNLSSAYIGTVFKKQRNQSLVAYINDYRIEIAKRLLAETDDPIKKVGYEVGYLNTNVFMRTFKKVTGITAGEYRDESRKEGAEPGLVKPEKKRKKPAKPVEAESVEKQTQETAETI